MKILEMCEKERPRERLMASGPGSLSNAELLSVLLRTGLPGESVLEISQKLLGLSGGSLGGLFELSATRLRSVRGIGKDKAATIMAAFELGKRFLAEGASVVKRPLVGPRMVYDIMSPELKGIDHEECWVMYLNGSNYLMGKSRMSSGGGNSTTIDIKQILRGALDRKAHSLILVHNHPSSNPRPSRADLEWTRSLTEAAGTMDLALLDHIIICDDCFYSIADEKMYFK